MPRKTHVGKSQRTKKLPPKVRTSLLLKRSDRIGRALEAAKLKQ